MTFIYRFMVLRGPNAQKEYKTIKSVGYCLFSLPAVPSMHNRQTPQTSKKKLMT